MTSFERIEKVFLKMLKDFGIAYKVREVGDSDDNWYTELVFEDGVIIKLEQVFEEDYEDDDLLEDRIIALEDRVAALETPWSVPSPLGGWSGVQCPSCKSTDTILLVTQTSTGPDVEYQWNYTHKSSYRCKTCNHLWQVPNDILITYSGTTASCSGSCDCKEDKLTQSQAKTWADHKRY